MQADSIDNYLVRFKYFLGRVSTDITFRNGILFTVFAFINNGISFLLLIILAKYIAPSGYGNLNLFNTFILITGIVISLSTGGYISVSYFNRSKEEFRSIVSSITLISVAVFSILLIILILFSGLLENLVGIESQFQITALIICFFQVFYTMNLEIWRLEEKPVRYGLYSILLAILNLVITLFLVINVKQDWLGRVYAQFTVAFLFFIISTIFIIKRNLLTWEFPGHAIIKECVLFGIPLIPHLASSWIRQGLDRYIVNNYHTITDVGLFSFAMNFSNIILIVGTAFNASNSVFLFRNLASPTSGILEKIRKYNILMFSVFFLLTIIVIVGARFFISAITPEYSGSIKYLTPLCISMLFQSVYFLYVNYLFYYRKTASLMYITFTVSVIHLILSFILTRYSIIYTAYISVFSSFLIFILVRYSGAKLVNNDASLRFV